MMESFSSMKKKEYYKEIKIERVAFYGYGIITRFCIKNSDVVLTELNGNTDILSQSLRSPNGEMTTYILNKSNEEQRIKLNYSGISNHKFFLYRVTEVEVVETNYKMNHVQELNIRNGEEIILAIPKQSICTLTNMKVLHEDPAKQMIGKKNSSLRR